MRELILDIEIEKGILSRGESPIEGIEYCKGWRDFEGMGIAYVGFYYQEKYLYFHGFQKTKIQEMINQAEKIITFNGNAFDRKLLLANGINCPETYDLLEEVREASGQPRQYVYGKTRGGYSLSAIARANGLEDKKGNGALAPIWYQRGELEKLIEYLKHDLYLTKEIYQRRNKLIDPTNRELLNI